MSDDVSQHAQPDPGEAASLRRADGADLVGAALSHLRRGLPSTGAAHGTPTLARQKESLREWARGLGLLLSPAKLPTKVVRGGQEHDLFHDEATDRYFKVTRGGIFGLAPGIDLALVSSGEDARRFHLWEATPLEYLERLHLQNQLVPGLNRLEGVLDPGDDLAVVISQPRFDLVPVTQPEIDAWFERLGFVKVTECGYYRAEDNLGIFDAHTKNLVRFHDDLIPFDVIPCRPAGGFLQFIADTLAAGHTVRAVRAVRTVTTTPRSA